MQRWMFCAERSTLTAKASLSVAKTLGAFGAAVFGTALVLTGAVLDAFGPVLIAFLDWGIFLQGVDLMWSVRKEAT